MCPRDFTVLTHGKRGSVPPFIACSRNQANNNAMGVLLADNVTIVQMQPAYRCISGGSSPLLARFGNGSADGCPQQFPNVTSIFGDGALGSHGGSGLSGVGGTIRLHELLNTTGPIPHALKIELQYVFPFLQPLPAPASAPPHHCQLPLPHFRSPARQWCARTHTCIVFLISPFSQAPMVLWSVPVATSIEL
jgi:hypothetical protein